MKNKIIILLAFILLCLLSIVTIFTVNYKNEKEYIAEHKNENIVTSETDEVYSVAYNHEEYKNIPVNYICPLYAHDTSTPEQAIGLADYAFIGKINRILRTEYRYPMDTVIDGEIKTVSSPYTVYEVNVVQNINGNLVKGDNIEIVQSGGLEEDKLSYSFFEGMSLLNVGEYYILLAYTQPDGTLLFDKAEFSIPLGNLEGELVKTISSKSTGEILSTTKTNSTSKPNSTPVDIINKYVEASKEPIVPEDRQKSKSKLYDIEYNK